MNNIPLVLASGSQGRHDMLTNAGLDFKTRPADIDEQALIQKLITEGKEFFDIALALSNEKALAISEQYQDHYIIGSDQLLIHKNEIYSKSKNTDEAIQKLSNLSGETHVLISGVSVVLNGKVKWSFADYVDLTMHDLSSEEIKNYVNNNKDICRSCVGGYAIEGEGVQLFSDIQGDFFTIMGMPLLPLLNYLRGQGAL